METGSLIYSSPDVYHISITIKKKQGTAVEPPRARSLAKEGKSQIKA